MSYKIKEYTYKQAAKLNVKVVPSKYKNKKIDVYNNKNEYITSIGASGMSDYPIYIQTHGSEYANIRRNLFYSRFKNKVNNVGSTMWYSAKLLW